MSRGRTIAIGLGLVVAACAADDTAGPGGCAGTGLPPLVVLECLDAEGIISSTMRFEGDSILAVATQVSDSLRRNRGVDGLGYWWSGYLETAAGQLTEYRDRRLLDEVRARRLLDHLAVTLEFVRGALVPRGEQYYPARTPGLTWVFYGGNGIFLQPVTSVERVVGIPLPDPSVSVDSLARLGDALWSQAEWQVGPGGDFPVWEYDFTYRSNYLDLQAPWRSGMAQGEALRLYSELYRRTRAPVWLDRANLVLRSMKAPWSQGGFLADDTTHGFWWDEYDPVAKVWNGSMVALIGVGLFAAASGQADAVHMWQRGLEAARYWTPFIDDGRWTRYSLLVGYVNVPYQQWHIQLADALFELSGDSLWQSYADRWRSYTPPAQVLAPVAPNEAALLPLLQSSAP